MSMKLTPDDLIGIAGKVREIAGLGIAVESFKIGTHRVMLGWEGPGEPYVVGITAGDWSQKLGGALREYEKAVDPDKLNRAMKAVAPKVARGPAPGSPGYGGF